MLGKYQHKPCVAMDTILQECLPEVIKHDYKCEYNSDYISTIKLQKHNYRLNRLTVISDVILSLAN